jgi:hypothetical protein
VRFDWQRNRYILLLDTIERSHGPSPLPANIFTAIREITGRGSLEIGLAHSSQPKVEMELKITKLHSN